MKKLMHIFAFLCFLLTSYSQGQEFKEYSYTEFIRMIEQEKDSVFSLKDAYVKYNESTDTLFTIKLDIIGYNFVSNKKNIKRIIYKEIKLDNVHFIGEVSIKNNTIYGALDNIQFEKQVHLRNIANVYFNDCVFKKHLEIRSDEDIQNTIEKINKKNSIGAYISISNSELMESASSGAMFMDLPKQYLVIEFASNTINLNYKGGRIENEFFIIGRNMGGIILSDNTFIGNGYIHYRSIENDRIELLSNHFNEGITEIYIDRTQGWKVVTIENNTFNNMVFWEMDGYDPKFNIPYGQFMGNLWSLEARNSIKEYNIDPNLWWKNDSLTNTFKKELIENVLPYKREISQKGMLYDFYKAKHDLEDANKVYIDIKDLETSRLKYLYNENPSFKTFFKWKVNQFLKLFSDYGTEPSKAIVFSFYVILCFALIYLFFPNSWDKHGKNRIVDRYTFFMKYMNKNAGIHEVYLEDKKGELLQYDEFKKVIETSGKTVPKFFSATALPLYKWAISGTKFSAALLKRFDIIKGTWMELPKSKRIWKSFLLIGAFLIALVYDIFIKMLNALMLSINTFTTLGFGEIPIKGLPRYLAIIQGFIGWFMLTIFSVSLISQLLN